MDSQAAIEGADQLWLFLVKAYGGILSDKKEVQVKREQLKKKEVIISAFGRHNCGKSTLLNVLLGNSCLPINIQNETGIEVKVRHDSTVHPGPCGDSCKGDCPRLVLELPDMEQCIIAAQGAVDIEDKLHSANEHWRQTGLKNIQEHKCYVLYGYVPILENAPSGWTLTLLDTPGFGEANVDHVTALTETLFSTSTAYLYIMDSGSMEDAVDAKNIGKLYKHDKDLFNDGRCVVAISKYDLCFSSRRTGQQRARRRKSVISVHSLQQTAQSFISSSIHVVPHLDTAIPVSAVWAETARYLRQNPQDEECIREAREILDRYPDNQPQGQGGVAMSPLDLASNIESTSGILLLEERLKTMLKRCIQIWETSLVTAYTGYLEEAKNALVLYRDEQQHKKETIKAMLALYEEYTTATKRLTDLAFVDEGHRPEIEVVLEKKYAEIDVQAARRLFHGRIDAMVKAFSNVMKEKVENISKPVSQRDFEREVKAFIQEEAEQTLSAEQQNIKLEGVGAAFRNSLREIEELDRYIEETAKRFLPPKWSPGPAYEALRKDRDSRDDKNIFSDEVLQRKQLTLGDLQRQANAPRLKIGLFQQFWDSVKKFFGATVQPEEERPYKKWGKEMDDTVETLRKELVKEVDEYVTNTLQHWVIDEVLSVEYRNRVKKRAEVLMGALQRDIREAKQQMDEALDRCASDDYMTTLDENIQKIETAQENLVAK